MRHARAARAAAHVASGSGAARSARATQLGFWCDQARQGSLEAWQLISCNVIMEYIFTERVTESSQTLGGLFSLALQVSISHITCQMCVMNEGLAEMGVRRRKRGWAADASHLLCCVGQKLYRVLRKEVITSLTLCYCRNS